MTSYFTIAFLHRFINLQLFGYPLPNPASKFQPFLNTDEQQKGCKMPQKTKNDGLPKNAKTLD